MNPPQVYMCSPSWTLFPPPSPFHPSGSSQCTSPKHPVSWNFFLTYCHLVTICPLFTPQFTPMATEKLLAFYSWWSLPPNSFVPYIWDSAYVTLWVSLVVQMVKNLPAMPETHGQSLGREDALEKGMATHFSILAWRIPWIENPGRLYSPWHPKELPPTLSHMLLCMV